MSALRCSKIIVLALFLFFLLFVFLKHQPVVERVQASTNLQGGNTGAPGGELTCATIGCHTANLNQGRGNLTITILSPEGTPVGTYIPGTLYSVRVTEDNADPVFKRWGFQLTALKDSDNTKAGRFISLDDLTQVVDNSGPVPSRQYINHRATDAATYRGRDQAVWLFQWQPDADVGSVTFYLAGAQCNNDGGSNGDEIYTKTVQLRANSSGQNPPPHIDSVNKQGKKLFVLGSDFIERAAIYLDSEKQKTSVDSSTQLTGKKAGKKVKDGTIIQVINPDGGRSNEYRYGVDSCSIDCPAPQTLTASSTNGTVVNYPTPVLRNCASGATFTCAPPAGANFPVGSTTVTCTVAGGSPSCTFTVNVTPPSCTSVSCPDNQTVTVSAGQTSAVVNYPAPTTTGSCGTVTCTPPSGSSFTLGTTTVNCSTQSGPSCTFTVTVSSSSSCTLTCPSDITRAGGAQVVNYSPPTTSGTCGTVTCTPVSGSTFPVGTTTVICQASTGGSCSFNIIITAPPSCTINCSGNLTVQLNPGEQSRSVNYPPPETTGTCGTVSCNPASGSVFALGTTTVICMASVGGSCSFTITLLPSQPSCQLTCPANVTVTVPPGQTSTTVSYPAPTTTGTCGAVTCAPPSGSTFSVGVTSVTCAESGGSRCSFTITVNQPGGAAFSNNAPITINDANVATPYPSIINVSGLIGTVTKVVVTINQFRHTFPSDVDILLGGPNGRGVMLMSDVSGGSSVNNITLTFDDNAPSQIVGQLTSGTYKPTDRVNPFLGDTDIFRSPAPPRPYTLTLATFNGINPNGNWSLYVMDEFIPDVGRIEGGWGLQIETSSGASVQYKIR